MIKSKVKIFKIQIKDLHQDLLDSYLVKNKTYDEFIFVPKKFYCPKILEKDILNIEEYLIALKCINYFLVNSTKNMITFKSNFKNENILFTSINDFFSESEKNQTPLNKVINEILRDTNSPRYKGEIEIDKENLYLNLKIKFFNYIYNIKIESKIKKFYELAENLLNIHKNTKYNVDFFNTNNQEKESENYFINDINYAHEEDFLSINIDNKYVLVSFGNNLNDSISYKNNFYLKINTVSFKLFKDFISEIYYGIQEVIENLELNDTEDNKNIEKNFIFPNTYIDIKDNYLDW